MKIPSFVRLDNPVQHYAWGSPDFIPNLLGRPNPDRIPHAELWIGAHPRAPSVARFEGETLDLPSLIRRHPDEILGTREPAATDEGSLPFLFKVLAAAAPLSIQAHPDREQARTGFARENAAGIPLDAPERNYKDSNHKPELIVALEDFWALQGFRDPRDIATDLERLGVAALGEVIDLLRGPDGLRPAFERLLTLPAETSARALGELAASSRRLPPDRQRFAERLLADYPRDIGVFAIVFLHLVHLRPLEGLFLHARQLHAYLAGAGLEVMTNSDNVLRGGLTAKHVDVPELLRTLSFTATTPTPLRAVARDHRWEYPTPASEFRLCRLDLAGETITDSNRSRLEILLCTEGQATLRTPTGDKMTADRGETILIPASTPTVEYSGPATVWLATTP